jgi:hypothetical protein
MELTRIESHLRQVMLSIELELREHAASGSGGGGSGLAVIVVAAAAAVEKLPAAAGHTGSARHRATRPDAAVKSTIRHEVGKQAAATSRASPPAELLAAALWRPQDRISSGVEPYTSTTNSGTGQKAHSLPDASRYTTAGGRPRYSIPADGVVAHARASVDARTQRPA